MIELLILIIIIILLILGIIWGHFFGSQRQQTVELAMTNQLREQDNVNLYHEHKAEIEADYQQGKLDQESYQYLLAELDKSLLQDIEQHKNSTAELAQQKPMSILWPIGLSLFVLVFSIAMYSKNGAYQQLNQPRVSQAQSNQQQANAQSQEQALHQQMEQLLQRTKDQPQDTEAWYSLGQTYVGMGEFERAIAAFDQVIAIEGVHADLLGAKAQATYYAAEQQITPQVQALIDQALAIDASDPSTNILLGMHNFMSQRYQDAINYWQKVIESGRENVNVQALQQAVNEAQSRLSLTGNNEDATTDTGPQIRLNVSLSDEIGQILANGEDKVVFVYAVPANGARMPVAAVKVMASDLPLEIVLNDARAMSPQMNLSSVERVNIYAVVSQLGGAGIQSGDFKTEVNDIAVSHSDTIELIIDSKVP